MINCLDDPDVNIRKGGTVTCCTILDRILKDRAFLTSGRAGKNASSDKNENDIFYILERLLMVGVADDDEDIRLTVFNSITKPLDPFVAKAENLSCVLDAINDERINVCSAAMSVIARLAYHSPTVIMPQLRNILVQLLRQLEQNDEPRLLENSIILLTEVSVVR